MIEEGEQAPDFRLPAVVDGERREVGLADHLDENVVVLAFYPGDFNPACDEESTDLDELDLFTMQKDVAVLGISGDSVHSHRAFAAEYDLHVPLLADVHGEVTGAYGVAADDPGYLTRRAVVVVDPEGVVRYAWTADSLESLPDVDRVRAAVESVGGGMALARYRVGHAHYVEGRRAFSSATGGFEDREWLLAKHDFTKAAEEFAEAAGAFASGEGREGERLRADAETPLETARDIPDPVPPDEFPPEDGTTGEPADPTPAGGTVDSPAVEVDGPGSDPAAGVVPDSDPAGGADVAAAGTFTRSAGGADSERTGSGRSDGDDEGGADGVDDAELAEITAELAEQSRDAAGADGSDGAEPGDTETVEGEVELDLDDPAGDGADGGADGQTEETGENRDERDGDDGLP